LTKQQRRVAGNDQRYVSVVSTIAFCEIYLKGVQLKSKKALKDTWLAKVQRYSRWITRGWTLEELIAPSTVAMYYQNWNSIGSKGRFVIGISEATGISGQVLVTGDLSQTPVAQKMSWAANQRTTRIEDGVYSLMGLFRIHMIMLYGEGDNTFRRRQEEIMRTTLDDSIFAWRERERSISSYFGLLARPSNDFEHPQRIKGDRGTFSTSNLGLRIETQIDWMPKEAGQHSDDFTFSCLRMRRKMEKR
jgi:hypothetical protein